MQVLTKGLLILVKVLGIILIIIWIFWETGNPFDYYKIKNALNDPHGIDYLQLLIDIHFSLFVTTSVMLNLFAIRYIKIFLEWLSEGKIGIGGRVNRD